MIGIGRIFVSFLHLLDCHSRNLHGPLEILRGGVEVRLDTFLLRVFLPLSILVILELFLEFVRRR